MIIFTLCVLLFINAMSIGLVFPIFASLFFQESTLLFAPDTTLYIKTLAYTMILSLPNICMIFGAPFLGRMSDHAGRKIVLLTALFGVGISFVLSAVAIFYKSLLALFISRAVAGFMDGSEGVAQAAIADISEPREKARNMGYATFAGTIGFIIGPVIGGFLAEPTFTGPFHFEIPFIIAFLLTTLNVLFLYIYFPKLAKSHDYPKEISYFTLLKKGFKILFDKRISLFFLLFFIFQWTLALFFQLVTLVLVEQYHYSSGDIGLYTMFLALCFSGGIFFVIYGLLHRVEHNLLLKSGIVLMIFALLIALFLQHTPLFPWISVLPLMFGIAMMYNVLLAFLSNAVSVKEQGDVMGSGTSLKALAWLTSGLVVSLLYPNILAVLILMLLVTIIGLIGARKLA